MKFNYYTICGSNAVLVLKDYTKAMHVRDTYMKRPRNIKGFITADDALAFAREHLLKIAGKHRIIPDHLELWKFHAVRDLPYKKNIAKGENNNE